MCADPLDGSGDGASQRLGPGLDMLDLDPFVLAAEFPAAQEERAMSSHADCSFDAVSKTPMQMPMETG